MLTLHSVTKTALPPSATNYAPDFPFWYLLSVYYHRYVVLVLVEGRCRLNLHLDHIYMVYIHMLYISVLARGSELENKGRSYRAYRRLMVAYVCYVEFGLFLLRRDFVFIFFAFFLRMHMACC